VRALQHVLQHVHKFTASLVDDMSVHCVAWRDHMLHLRKYLHKIKLSGITLNLRKSNFALGEVKFVGHVIGSGQHRANPDKISVVQNMDAPVDKKHVRQILDFFSYFREYIPNFAHTAEALTALTRKGKPDKVLWGQTAQRAFDQLKANLTDAANSPLVVIDCNKAFNLYVDTSNYACAVVLTQNVADQIDKLVAFASVRLTPTQRNWSTVEKEALYVYGHLKSIRNGCLGVRSRPTQTKSVDLPDAGFLSEFNTHALGACLARV